MNAFILDFKILEEHNLSIGGFLTLISIIREEKLYNDSENNLNKLQELGFIKKSGDMIILREKGQALIDFISIDHVAYPKKGKKIVKTDRIIDAQVDNMIDEYRNVWKGLKPGSRGSLQTCKEKLSAWMKANPQYSPEDIIKASKIYIKTLNNIQYLQQADNFIYKKVNGYNESRLSTFIDELANDVAEDWTTKIL